MPIHFPPSEFIDPCTVGNLPQAISGGSTQAMPGVSGLNCATGAGVLGQSPRGVGVRGESNSFVGVFGECNTGDGIQGRSKAPDHAGVSAVNDGTGFGLWASSRGEAGHFEGAVNIRGNLDVSGDVRLVNGDIAERFAVDQHIPFESGMVMAIGEDGALVPCLREYDKRVVGVVSGAGDLRPAVTLRDGSDPEATAVIALIGTVNCQVDADKAPIEIGDLLTSSDTPGHAMRAADPHRSFGAVIGKALAPLGRGRGLIPIVVLMR